MYNVIDCLFSHFHMLLCVIHSPEDGHMKDRNILGLYEVRVHNVLFVVLIVLVYGSAMVE
jgi:hypothetical protein